MALGTNYRRTPSGIYDLATCYKMAVIGNDESKKAEFMAAIERFPNVSDALRAKVIRDIAAFQKARDAQQKEKQE